MVKTMTPRKLTILVLLGFLIVFSACKKDGINSFTLQIKPRYGNQPFALEQANIDAQGRYIIMTTFRFYLSHINLVKSNGTQVNIAGNAFFSVDDSMLTVTAKNIQGDFTGITFACGLDSLTNDTTTPNLYAPPNPLSGYYDMYWPMIKYEFEVLEGKWDTAVMPVMRHGLVYHIGTNAAYRTTSLNQNFSINGSAYTMVLYLDVAQIFNNTTTGQTIDIATEPSSMSATTDNPVILPAFADNFSNAFSFNGP